MSAHFINDSHEYTKGLIALGFGVSHTTLPDGTTLVETFPAIEPREFRIFDRYGNNFPPDINPLLQ
jgi:hypothetical protein